MCLRYVRTHYSEHFQNIIAERNEYKKKKTRNKTSSSLCDNKAGYKTFYAIVIQYVSVCLNTFREFVCVTDGKCMILDT